MYLIDTHCLLWYLRDCEKLSQKAREIIDNEEQIFVSIISLWEIAIKRSIGKLDLDFSVSQIEELCIEKEISILPIKSSHLDCLEILPKIHNDPFDRLIICQAKNENLTLITCDTIIPKYDIPTVW